MKQHPSILALGKPTAPLEAPESEINSELFARRQMRHQFIDTTFDTCSDNYYRCNK